MSFRITTPELPKHTVIAVCPDVSVWIILQVGAVPIYRGAPNIDEYVPSNSIIRADEYDSARSLAASLRALLDAPERYAEYLRWKHKPPEPHMVRVVGISNDLLFERLCSRFRSHTAISSATILPNSNRSASDEAINQGKWWFEPHKHLGAKGMWV